jgi:hypothetical protein
MRLDKTDSVHCKLNAIVLAVAMLAGANIAPASAAAAPSSLSITSAVVIVERPDEAEPVKRAVADLQSDFEKVLGVRPRIVARLEQAGPEAIIVGRAAELPKDMVPAGADAPESFSISAGPGRVVLSGADVRGTIYAIYQFSQDYLGVDPMYYWTDKVPPKRKSIALPGDLAKVFPSPLFKYRGFFINDEDLLTGWAPGEFTDHSGISLAVMDKIYETILRLKGNMVVPSTWNFPTDPQIKLVAERGLILNQHHATPLGVNVARWPANVPYNYSEHPEILERAWKNAVASYDPHQEVLWSVGLRGLSDSSYASMDSSVVDNDKRLGMLIDRAIAKQMEIVRAVHPDAQFVTNLWKEGVRLIQNGDLKIPPEVNLVWADVGYGVMQDKGQLAPGQGAYYHVAMLNGRANQLSEMVPVDRIYSEFGRYIAARATGFMLVNTSDLRPVAMTAKAVMDVAWGGVPQGGSDRYYRDWAAYEFGAKAAEPLTRIYQDYFKAFARTPPGLPGEGQEYGDQLFHTEAQQMLVAAMISPPYYMAGGQNPTWTPIHILGIGIEPNYYRQIDANYVPDTAAREIKICGEAQARWDAVWKDALAAEAAVEPSRRPYYEAQMLAMIAINRASNHILYQVSKAVMDYRAGDRAKAKAEAEQTLKDFDEIERIQSKAEYGKWKNWYRGEWLVGIRRTRELVETFIRYADDPMTNLPFPVLANSWAGYYHIMHYEGDRTVDVH